jgi:hypothetical protein
MYINPIGGSRLAWYHTPLSGGAVVINRIRKASPLQTWGVAGIAFLSPWKRLVTLIICVFIGLTEYSRFAHQLWTFAVFRNFHFQKAKFSYLVFSAC